jgi:hypothetical protein
MGGSSLILIVLQKSEIGSLNKPVYVFLFYVASSQEFGKLAMLLVLL